MNLGWHSVQEPHELAVVIGAQKPEAARGFEMKSNFELVLIVRVDDTSLRVAIVAARRSSFGVQRWGSLPEKRVSHGVFEHAIGTKPLGQRGTRATVMIARLRCR